MPPYEIRVNWAKNSAPLPQRVPGMTRVGVERSSTGVPGLDEVLHGGLIRKRFYLIDGDPGAGKTTLALQYLLAGARAGESCLYVTLSETREELLAGAQSHDWSLDGIEIVELIPEDRDLTSGDELTMYHPSEVELTETTRRVLETVERAKPTRAVGVRDVHADRSQSRPRARRARHRAVPGA